jgi:hypothetical protein
VFNELLLTIGLHEPVVPPLLGAEDIEKTALSIVGQPSNGLFTRNLSSREFVYHPLRGNALTCHIIIKVCKI